MGYLVAEPLADISSYYQDMNGWGRILLAAVVLAAVVFVVGFIVLLINLIHRRNSEMAIKREMIERGMSADEIERILGAELSDESQNVHEHIRANWR